MPTTKPTTKPGVAQRSAQAPDLVLSASRALLGVVVTSLMPALEEVTLPQFRVLVILAGHQGPMRMGELADELGVHPSTFSRTADRLVVGNWIRRGENPESRRETFIDLQPRGKRLVDLVTRRRRAQIERILDSADASEVKQIVDGMEAFARIVGEPAAGELAPLGM
jgi:DNA-binding MarR family transcriptional regulator